MRRQSSRSRMQTTSSRSFRSRLKNLPKMTKVWTDHKDCQGILSRVSISKRLEGRGKDQNFHSKYWNVFSDSHFANGLPCHTDLCLPAKLVHIVRLQC